MAVEDKYINSDIASGYIADRALSGKIVGLTTTFEIAAADDDGSVYRLFKEVPANWIPYLGGAVLACDAITAGTDFDLGVYAVGVGGAAVDADCLMDGQTLASASRTLDPYQTIAIDAVGQPLWELAGQASNPSGGYDIALTGNTVGSAAGTVSIALPFLIP